MMRRIHDASRSPPHPHSRCLEEDDPSALHAFQVELYAIKKKKKKIFKQVTLKTHY